MFTVSCGLRDHNCEKHKDTKHNCVVEYKVQHATGEVVFDGYTCKYDSIQIDSIKKVKIEKLKKHPYYNSHKKWLKRKVKRDSIK